jgi:hypothetical protein
MFNVSVRKIVVSTVAIAAPVAFSFGASSEAWGGATHNWEKNTGTHAAKTHNWEKTSTGAAKTHNWEKTVTVAGKTHNWERTTNWE